MADPRYTDDPTIESDDMLWRRIPPFPERWTYDHNEGRLRPNSDCFTYSKNPKTGEKHPMSVVLAKAATSIAEGLIGADDYKLVQFSAEVARGDKELGVARDPQPGAPAHSLVFTLAPGQSEIPKKAQRRMAKAAEWLVGPSAEETEVARQRTLPQD